MRYEPKSKAVQEALQKLKERDYATYIWLTEGEQALENAGVPELQRAIAEVNPLKIYAISLEELVAPLKDALWYLDRCEETLKAHPARPERQQALRRLEAQRQGIKNLLAVLEALLKTGPFAEA